MGATYTRQSSGSIVDGSTIEAAHFNNEFDQLLAAFASSSGHTHDGTAGEGGPITKLLGTSITVGDGSSGTDITLTFDGETNDGALKWMEDEDYFEFSDDILVASTEKLQFRDTAIYINSSTDGQLDLVADTEIQIAATTIDINGNADISGNLGIGGNLTVTGTTTFNGGTLTLGDADTDNIVFGGEVDSDIIPDDDDTHDLGSSSKKWKDLYIDGVAYLDAINFNGTLITSTAAELNLLDGVTATTSELNILDGVTSTASELNLVDGITAGTVSASKAVIVDSNKDLTGLRNLTISGDLTVSGDDITMGTNTAGNLLIADGTNFNSVAVGSLSEISTVANDDVFLAVDTSGGGLKKVTRSAVVAGLATSSAISNVAEDSTPQLGGNLDLNGNDIVTTSNADLELAPNGTGHVTIRGNTNQGTIQFNCENNSHGQQVKAAPHSESASNVLTLPSTGGDSRLVSAASTATLTNKTLTSPKINEDVAVTSTATEINLLDGVTATTAELNILDGVTTTAAEINLIDGGTARGTTAVASGDGILINDGGTMRMTNVDTVSTYFAGHNVGGSNIVTTGALNSGSITSGFGSIDTGSSTITTTGLISGGSLDIDNVLINGTTIGHTDDTDLITVADGLVTVAGEVQMTTLDIGGTNVTSTAAELNILDGVTSTAAELNILDGVTSTTAELNILDGVTATAAELNFSDLATLGTTAASKVYTADANGLTKISGAALYTEDTLTDGSTVAWDVIASPVAKLTMAGNRTLSAPSGTTPAAGQFVSLLLIQDGTGSRTITFNAVYEFTGDEAPTLTTTANKGDLFVFRYNGSKWLEVGRNLNLTLS